MPKYWQNHGLAVTDRLEYEDSAAVFGTFTYESNTQHRTITSSFCISGSREKRQDYLYAVHGEYIGTALTFKKSGTWQVQSDPDGETITV